MNSVKFVVIDLETTGLDFLKHEIIDIGCVFFTYNIKTKQYVLENTFESKIIPEHIEDADEQALKVNKFNEKDWENALPLKTVLKKISPKLKERIVIGHNVGFDYYFLDQSFKKVGVKNTLHYHTLDTISMAYTKLKSNPDVQRLSLAYLCNYFDIKNTNFHQALSDAEATFELFKKIMNYENK